MSSENTRRTAIDHDKEIKNQNDHEKMIIVACWPFVRLLPVNAASRREFRLKGVRVSDE